MKNARLFSPLLAAGLLVAFNGSVSSNTVASNSVALSTGGFSFFGTARIVAERTTTTCEQEATRRLVGQLKRRFVVYAAALNGRASP